MDASSKKERAAVTPTSIVLAKLRYGSDACSGISANSALGVVSDLLVREGGTSIIAETTELMGAEHLLAERAVNDTVAHVANPANTRIVCARSGPV